MPTILKDFRPEHADTSLTYQVYETLDGARTVTADAWVLLRWFPPGHSACTPRYGRSSARFPGRVVELDSDVLRVWVWGAEEALEQSFKVAPHIAFEAK